MTAWTVLAIPVAGAVLAILMIAVVLWHIARDVSERR